MTLVLLAFRMMGLKALFVGKLRENAREEGPMSSKRRVRRRINDGSTMYPYRCQWCGFWHYGPRTYRLESIISAQAAI